MAQSALTWEFEKTAFGQGKIVCGTDEAGRGPLAGRVYAAAVVLDTDDSQNPVLLELNDSKKLTEKKRFSLEDPIKNISKSWCVAYSTVEEIESTDILSASLHAMSRAIQGLGIDRSLDEKTLESMCISGVG
jgi:ribonuclease HII